MPEAISWELYNLADDRCEMTNLAAKQPDRVKRMATDWVVGLTSRCALDRTRFTKMTTRGTTQSFDKGVAMRVG